MANTRNRTERERQHERRHLQEAHRMGEDAVTYYDLDRDRIATGVGKKNVRKVLSDTRSEPEQENAKRRNNRKILEDAFRKRK